MEANELIDQIYFKGSIFRGKNYTREINEIFISLSKTNVEKIVLHFIEIRQELKAENVYGKIRVHGFNIVSSEMLTDEQIVIGLIENFGLIENL
jgi:hypothetical protein